MKPQLITSKGTQFRTVRKTDPETGKKYRVQEALAPGYTLALIDGTVQTVKS